MADARLRSTERAAPISAALVPWVREQARSAEEAKRMADERMGDSEADEVNDWKEVPADRIVFVLDEDSGARECRTAQQWVHSELQEYGEQAIFLCTRNY